MFDPDTLHINLVGNQIETLDLRRFLPFKGLKLQSLDLSSNPLKAILVESQSGTSIHTLKLNNCSLSTLPWSLFQGSIGKSLKVLHLSDNNQPLFLEDYLMRQTNLEELVLERNGLSYLYCLKLASVESLSLGGNPFGNNIWNISLYIDRVKHLYLNDIGWTRIALLAKTNGLETLSLADNRITELNGDDLLSHGESIVSLNLRNNTISSITDNFSDMLPNLRVLDFGRNRLRIFKMLWIQNSHVTHLHLDHNYIFAIPIPSDEAQRKLDSLNLITLNGNPLHCNCELLWFRDWGCI